MKLLSPITVPTPKWQLRADDVARADPHPGGDTGGRVDRVCQRHSGLLAAARAAACAPAPTCEIAITAASNAPSANRLSARSIAADHRHALQSSSPKRAGSSSTIATACCVSSWTRMSRTWVAPSPAPISTSRLAPGRASIGSGRSTAVDATAGDRERIDKLGRDELVGAARNLVDVDARAHRRGAGPESVIRPALLVGCGRRLRTLALVALERLARCRTGNRAAGRSSAARPRHAAVGAPRPSGASTSRIALLVSISTSGSPAATSLRSSAYHRTTTADSLLTSVVGIVTAIMRPRPGSPPRSAPPPRSVDARARASSGSHPDRSPRPRWAAEARRTTAGLPRRRSRCPRTIPKFPPRG